ncbi:cyclic nucleotide-binding domain-containing protein, partial [Candidatus Sumerlaeota bacterium]|nr:cyclic nucleotide-binding domain-containing protein [Candidatus Sumerlaeota bacterium]
NIFLASDGQIKLMDFGLARDETDAYQTQLGVIVGTPLYLAPEQARGEKGVDARADIYALGITLFHCVTGHIPFEDLSVPLILTKKTVQAIPAAREYNPEVSDNLATVLSGMCERDVSLRYPNMGAVIEDLERLLARQPPLWGQETAKRRTVVIRPAVPAVASAVFDDPILRSVILESHGLTKMVDYPADHVIYFEGDESKDVYLLIGGEVEVLKAGIRIAVINTAGSFFGEVSGLLGAPRSATIRTRTPIRACRIDQQTFANFLKTFPALNYQLAVMLADRLQKTTEDYYEMRNKFRTLARQLNILESLFHEHDSTINEKQP